MKTIIAYIMLAAVLTLICMPLILIYVGLTADASLTEHILVTGAGVILCRLVKPVSIITGRDLKF